MSSQPFYPRKSVIALLWSFAFLSYMLRINITVAQQYMARDLLLTDVQIGSIFSAFLIGYTIFQLPGGVLGDRFGPRMVLGVSCVCWIATTALTGLLPGRLLPGLAMAVPILLVVRFLNGVGQAATYPAAMAAVALWFPARQHAFINALIFTGSTVGSACAPPLVAYIMTEFGWRATFYLTAIAPLMLAVVWFRRTRNLPAVNPAKWVGNDVSWWRILQTRNVFFLCVSYFLYCYAISIFVYWLFKYLVDVRGLSIMNSGWVNSLPWITASIAVPVMGYLTVKLSDRVGFLQGRRAVAMSCLLVASLLLYAGVRSPAIVVAIAAIAVSVGLLFSTESCYFSTAIEISGGDAGAASGLMNLAGNLGGVAATSGVPLLVLHYGWLTALMSGAAFALLAALVWVALKVPSGQEADFALPVS